MNQMKNGIVINFNVSVKATVCAKRNYRWNPSTCTSIFENSRYLISVVDDSAIACDEIMSVKDSVSTYVTNAISTNATSTVPTNYDYKKARYEMGCCILHSVLLVTMLLPIIAISLCKTKAKTKTVGALTIYGEWRIYGE